MKNDNTSPKVRVSLYTVFFKRLLDVFLSSIAIIVFCPLFLVITLLELIFHGKPVLFSQKRTGLHGKTFTIYKFRSMTNETDDNGNLLSGSQRLTKFGKLIRKYSIDELPELFCIFVGKMSFIGPRPLPAEYLPLYNERHFMRHELKPVLACVRIKASVTWTWGDQFENDIWYIENCSFMVDLRMLFAVARETIHPSAYRIDATRKPFNGKNFDD